MNTMVQFLALYTDPERHNAQGYRRTDDIVMPIADHIVRSAKKTLQQQTLFVLFQDIRDDELLSGINQNLPCYACRHKREASL